MSEECFVISSKSLKDIKNKLAKRVFIPNGSNRVPNDADIIPESDWYPGDDIYQKLLTRPDLADRDRLS